MVKNDGTIMNVWGSDAGMSTLNTDWAHVVWVFQSDILYTYYNGSLAGTNSNVPFRTITRDNHLIGKSTWNNSTYAHMKMAYFRVYQGTELTSTDVTTLYDNRENTGDIFGTNQVFNTAQQTRVNYIINYGALSNIEDVLHIYSTDNSNYTEYKRWYNLCSV